MSIKILKPGLFSTIQDLGRIGYQDQGFSTAGVLDSYAFRLGQALINNEGPAIECTVIGPEIQFLEDNAFVITGALFDAKLNDESVSNQTVYSVEQGDVLKLGQAVTGARGYVLFENPLDLPLVAESYSTHTRSQMGGLQGRVLKPNDIIPCKTIEDLTSHVAYSLNIDHQDFEQNTIRIIEGSQIDAFSQEAQEILVSNEYKISEKSDRMGYRLQGENISPEEKADIISEPVALGSIQVPNDGNPIILLNDKQTVGGYTKIATVCAADLSVLAQKKPGETIHFEWSTVESAIESLEQKEKSFQERIKQVVEMPTFDINQMRRTSTRINNLLKGE